MGTARLTKIENLPEAERKFVEDMLLNRPRPTTSQISAYYKEKFGKHLAPSTIQSHLQRRLEVQRRRTLEVLAEKRATCELIGTNGLDFAAQAQIWEAVQGMTAGQLILLRSVETKRKDLELKEKAQATRNRELELKVKQFETQRETERKVIAGVVTDKNVSDEEARRKIQEMYGIVESAEEHSAPAALPEAVG